MVSLWAGSVSMGCTGRFLAGTWHHWGALQHRQGWEESREWNVYQCMVTVGENHLEGEYRTSFCSFEEFI